MSAPHVVLLWGLLAAGLALAGSELPWFRRTPRLTRVAPYSRRPHDHRSAGTAESLRQVVSPGLERWGARLSRAFGVADDLATRLERSGSTMDPASFRVRQAARAVVALLAATAAVLVVGLPPYLALAAVLGAPVLVVLAEEHRLGAAIDRRRARVLAELPVVTEQLGLLLSAGYSLPGALTRLAERSDGTVAADLRKVVRRTRHGLGPTDALSEWAAATGSDAIDRLVAVLRLHDDAGDLGMLISEEARSIRAGAHRDLVEQIERRAQLVWIPVTVATLVPGLIFLAVPFMSALTQVTGGN